MAKCTIDPITGQILTISGRLGNTLFKTYRDGQVRAYLLPPQGYQRSTRVTKAEILARSRFAYMASEVARRVKAGDPRPRKLIWQELKTELASESERMQA